MRFTRREPFILIFSLKNVLMSFNFFCFFQVKFSFDLIFFSQVKLPYIFQSFRIAFDEYKEFP
jgi:hypothetical protein